MRHYFDGLGAAMLKQWNVGGGITVENGECKETGLIVSESLKRNICIVSLGSSAVELSKAEFEALCSIRYDIKFIDEFSITKTEDEAPF